MEDKSLYIEQLIRIRESVPMTWQEMSVELEMSNNTLKKFMDEEDKTPIRALAMRKIKTLVNKYKDQV